jgi:RHS repeat-associated protein
MLCDGTSFADPVQISTSAYYGPNSGLSGKVFRNSSGHDAGLLSSDCDGDGINDVFLCDHAGSWSISSFTKYPRDGSFSFLQKASGSNSYLTDIVFLADFNGDGKAEIWGITPTGIYIYAFDGTSTLKLIYSSTNSIIMYHCFTIGDFNGDGKSDIFLYGIKQGSNNQSFANWQILLSTGTGFDTQFIPKKKDNLINDDVRTGDFNGDGCTDLMVTPKDNSWSGTYYFITKNKGKDINSPALPFFPISSKNYFVADYNGDGRSDFICLGDVSSNWTGYRLYNSEGNTSVFMDKVSNGLNQLTKINYSKLSQPNSAVYLKGNNAVFPVFDYQGPYSVVSSINIDNGLGGQNTINYTYEGAKIHRQGKGFLCFTKTTTTDLTEGTETVSQYDYNPTYYYPQLNTFLKRLANGGTVYETSTNSWTQKVLDSGQKRIFPYIGSSTQTNNLTGLSVSMSTTLDDFGNPTLITKSFSGGRTETTTNAFSNIESSSDWRIGRLDQSTITYTKSGETSISRTTSYTYSTNGIIKPDHVYSLAGTGLYTYKDNNYDNYGNLLQVLAHNSNGDTKQTSFTYDSDGIKIMSATDPLGHVTSNLYDSFGRLATQQDYLNNTISFQYDDFGRLTTESRPDGSQTSTSYLWNGTNEPALGVYGIMKSSNNGATSIVWNDKLGRGIRSCSNGFDGTIILSDMAYNSLGQLYQTSEPYFSGGNITWTTNTYDSFGRMSSISRPSGNNTSYAYSNNTTSETTAGKTYSKTYASDGSLISATDNGGTINYTYFSDGQIKTITSPEGAVTGMQYDIAGNQIQLSDPSAGTSNYTYDGFGQLLTQTDAKGQQTTMSYLPDGRVNSKTTPEGTYTYTYNSNKQLSGISSPSNISRSYNYDSQGRITSLVENIQGSPFTSSFTYDNIGRISSHTFPSGITETITYNANGYLSSIAAGGSTRHTVTGMNARQQLTASTFGNNLQATSSYDDYGFPTATSTGNIQNYAYSFNSVTGNLNWRKNILQGNIQENFEYDNLDRLSRIYQGATTMLNMAYSGNGNITTKSDIGTSFGYNNISKPYALTNVSTSSGLIPDISQTIVYNSFEKIDTITEGQWKANFTYNSDNERCKMDVLQNGSSVLTRWYAGTNYIKELAGSTIKEYTFIGGDAYSAPVVAVTQGGSTSWYYLLRDNLGSITHVVDASNNTVLAEYSYDAWGRRRNPGNWSYDLTGQPDLFAGRGFTGHETLAQFGLINMNGRLYDPLAGRFLSPDPYVQMPDFTQNLNRYTYGLNNPLKYNDPSGEFWEILVAALIGGVQNWATHGEEFSWKGLGYFGVGALTGAFGGYSGEAITNFGGFYGGFLSGTPGYGTDGFIGSAGNAWISGANLGEGLKAGLLGGIFGGTARGVSDYQAGYSFWNGSRVDELIDPNQYKETAETWNNKSSGKADSNLLAKVERLTPIRVKSNGLLGITTIVDNGFRLTPWGEYVNSNNALVLGYCVSNRSGYSYIHISPYSAISVNDLEFKATLYHEYNHSLNHYTMRSSYNNVDSERSSYKLQYDFYMHNGLTNDAEALRNTAIFNHGTGFDQRSFWGAYSDKYEIPLLIKLQLFK